MTFGTHLVYRTDLITVRLLYSIFTHYIKYNYNKTEISTLQEDRPQM
jgi:hypothetical protein